MALELLSHGRILIVDADPAWSRRIGLILQSAGYDIDEVPSGSAALEYLCVINPDAVFFEIDAASGTGRSMFAEVRRRMPWVPLIAVSNQGTVPMVVSAFKQGVIDFLEKPISERALLAAASRAVECPWAGNHPLVDAHSDFW